MGLWSEYKRLWGQHPLNAAVLTLSVAYGVDKLGKAMDAEAGEFYGIGATTSTSTTTSSSHPMNRPPAGDMMKHPIALFGYNNIGSNCTGGVHGACSNPHCATHGGMGSVSNSTSTSSVHAHKLGDYGNDTYESPQQLFGVPNGIKRRVMINSEDSGGYNNAQVSHLFGHNQTPTGMTSADVEAIADMAGF